MTNAELIKSARTIADSIHVHSSFQDWEAAEKDTLEKCADALEAAEKRIAELEAQLPAVDAVPVTRCAQCKWCDYPVPNSTKYGCRLFDRCVKGDWYCADGERRQDEQ